MLDCPSCSRQIPADSRLCPYCGAALGSEVYTQTVPQAKEGPATPERPSDSALGSSSIGHGRFLPGTMLSERYRIVSLLGEGGMGEVYRADDLELCQSVALKFLPPQVATDAATLERFRGEVRTARQIAHPNVCRVYDIAQEKDQYFLSMEHVDGEDLSVVLRRMGRPSKEKALQIARQLCAGLAAAHQNGILHRDLKPANVMIDGRGRVRITDFGLAGLAGSFQGQDIRAGTPAYMAPEQAAGKEVSVRSDVYSLGLVLYELFTGHRLFDAATVAELAQQRSAASSAAPSRVADDIDPAIERAIQRCLEADPADRPASVLAVLASLPGADPLAAALAAGETPLPELVAASGEVGALHPAVALVLAGVVALGVVLTAWSNDNVRAITAHTRLDHPPVVLAARAAECLERFGYDQRPVDTAYQLYYDLGYVEHLDNTDESSTRWERLAAPQPATVGLWYRHSGRRLVSTRRDGLVKADDSPRLMPGDAVVRVSAAGDLLSLRALRPALDADDAKRGEPFNWSIAFDLAGLDFERFTPVASCYAASHIACDARWAWSGPYRDNEGLTVRVEAASLRGWPVALTLLDPWERRDAHQRDDRKVDAQGDGSQEDDAQGGRLTKGESPEQPQSKPSPDAAMSGEAISRLSQQIVLFAALVGAGTLAVRNVRRGRGDRRSALRLAMFCTALNLLAWLVMAHHAGGSHMTRMAYGTGIALYGGAVAYALYLALEPFMRRRMPELLVSSTRLLAGRWRDPLVGRDILVGLAASGGISAIAMFSFVMDEAATGTPPRVGAPPAECLQSVGLLGGILASATAMGGVVGALFLCSIFSFLLATLRRRWLVVLVVCVLLTGWNTELYDVDSRTAVVDLSCAVALALLMTVVLARFGLLSLFACFVGATFYSLLPVTFRTDAWYAPGAYAVAAVLLGIAVAAYRIASAGAPLLKDDLART